MKKYIVSLPIMATVEVNISIIDNSETIIETAINKVNSEQPHINWEVDTTKSKLFKIIKRD